VVSTGMLGESAVARLGTCSFPHSRQRPHPTQSMSFEMFCRRERYSPSRCVRAASSSSSAP